MDARTPQTPDGSVPDVDRRMALAREWDDLVAEVRTLPDLADFLRPPRLSALLPAAAGGPVVILNVSRWRCDALIVRTSGVEVVDLPDLDLATVVDRVREYLGAVGARQAGALRGAPRDLSRDVSRDLRREPRGDDVETRLDDCLRWMWDSFARPVLDRLGHTSAPVTRWPRVWWCPTGPLTLLPIHAAGDHRTPGAAVIDRVVSSYTPTLRALLEARAARADAPGPARMLFVGMPETPRPPDMPDVEVPDLPNVAVEDALTRRLFAGRRTSLCGPAATREAVLGNLPGHSWVHFACHGEQNLDDPSRGGVLVHDGALTVTDLGSRQYRGEFAYLSGCKTAVGGVDLPDEAITLAAALHYTGYRHVIATLWSVLDREAAQVAGDVYAELTRAGACADAAAVALHHAVRRLREASRSRPSVWTPFAHTGP